MKSARPLRRPLFLDPDRYRRRRLMDAARMLPVLGAFLFLLPMLWQQGMTGHRTAFEGVYLFAVWAVLILFARLFAPGLAAVDAGAEAQGPLSVLPADGPGNGQAGWHADWQAEPSAGSDSGDPRDGKDPD